MKNKITLLLILGLIFNLQAQTTYFVGFNTDSDPGKLNVEIKVAFDVASNLASSNFQFDYDNNVLGNHVLTYTHPTLGFFNGYSDPEVTVLSATRLSLNIVWQYNSMTFPPLAIPAGEGNEVVIATIQFDVLDDTNPTSLTWFINGTAGTVVTQTAGTDEVQTPVPTPSPTDEGSISLPIELSAFTAVKRGETAKLDWTTATEVNASHFDVERSVNGSEWTVIGQVEARGESTSLVNYALNDNNVPVFVNAQTIAYYRLNMIDNDGAAAYSDVRTVVFEGRKEVISVHPNPTANYINVTSEFEVNNIRILDINGKLIINQKYDNGIIDLSDLQNGMYKVIVSTEAGDHVKSVIKID